MSSIPSDPNDHNHTEHHGHEHGPDDPHAPQKDHSDRMPDPEIALMEEALRSLLIEKGVVTAIEIQRAIETMSMRDATRGAAIIAKAWVDPTFKAALLEHANSAVAQFGVSMGVAELTVVENTPETHHLIVCTLCSCYPRALLGIPPAWYKTKAYRSRAVREPRNILDEFGLQLPEGQAVKVHDSTADLRFMVMPMRPAGTDGWDETSLAKLITRDSMIGVATALSPDTV